MSDLFHARVPLGFVRDVFAVIADTPQHTYQVLTKRSARLRKVADQLDWPANLWMGVSVENAGTSADRRPAPGRSCCPVPVLRAAARARLTASTFGGIGWVIAGGESGPRYRPMGLEWARGIRDACPAADVPFFFKQWGGRTPKALGRELDGAIWDEMPARSGGGLTVDRPPFRLSLCWVSFRYMQSFIAVRTIFSRTRPRYSPNTSAG